MLKKICGGINYEKTLGAKTIVHGFGFYSWYIQYNEKPDVIATALGVTSCSKPPCVFISFQKHKYILKNII